MMRGVANSITGLVSNQIALSECNLNAVLRRVAWPRCSRTQSPHLSALKCCCCTTATSTTGQFQISSHSLIYTNTHTHTYTYIDRDRERKRVKQKCIFYESFRLSKQRNSNTISMAFFKFLVTILYRVESKQSKHIFILFFFYIIFIIKIVYKSQ